MLPKINPTKTKSWKKLKEQYRVMKDRHMVDPFRRDPERFSRFSVTFQDMLVDYSKNIRSTPSKDSGNDSEAIVIRTVDCRLQTLNREDERSEITLRL